ncbi:hypothetical protein BJ322DRAFT_1024327 [Thelephora terrestris]|uniref:Uncharacterized protein n=1 Tax=Thelephora terrestris TaxID=56493 RepID=A0A9P6H685_9AGAM|nr:hypothetical protein BJ322DRAFT_1024327 [Thelephora terrestris]
MTFTPDDIFSIASSTAVGMGENLVTTLNTIIMNLPEADLRKVRDAVNRSLQLADDLLHHFPISPAFEFVSTSDGGLIQLRFFVHVYIPLVTELTTPGKETSASPGTASDHSPFKANDDSQMRVPPPSPASLAPSESFVYSSPVFGNIELPWLKSTRDRGGVPVLSTSAQPHIQKEEHESLLTTSPRLHDDIPGHSLHPEILDIGLLVLFTNHPPWSNPRFTGASGPYCYFAHEFPSPQNCCVSCGRIWILGLPLADPTRV